MQLLTVSVAERSKAWYFGKCDGCFWREDKKNDTKMWLKRYKKGRASPEMLRASLQPFRDW